MKTQTAVDFIVDQLDCLNKERKEKLIDAETYFQNKKALVEQAKEMENRQGYIEEELLNKLIELNKRAIDENWKMEDVGEGFFKTFAYNYEKKLTFKPLESNIDKDYRP